MALLAIVEDFDVHLDGRFRVGPCCAPLMMNHFVLQSSPKAFHRRVVVAVSIAGPGCPHAKLRDQRLIVICAVLAASGRVQNQRWQRCFPLTARYNACAVNSWVILAPSA